MFRRDTHEVVEHTKSDDGDRRIYLTEKARKVIKAAREYQAFHGYPTDGYIFALGDQIIPGNFPHFSTPVSQRSVNDHPSKTRINKGSLAEDIKKTPPR